MKAKLNEIQSFLNLDTTDNIKSLSNNLKTKKEVRDSSTKETFSNIEFSNVGSDIWKELWLAAKKFIEEGKGVFPDNKEGAKCPLCIQELSLTAIDRFKTFDSYLKEKFEQEYSEAIIALGVEYKAIKNLKFTFPDLEETVKDLKKEIEEFTESFSNYLKDAESYLSTLMETISIPDKIKPFEFADSKSPIVLISEHISAIVEINKTLEERKIDTEITKVNILLQNLKAHKKIANYKPQLVKEILRLRKIKALKDCIKKCNTRNVTLLSNKIAQEYVHDKIKIAFKDELSKLGFNHINVSLESKGERGKQYNYLSLSESYGSSTKLKDILSEGEHRCIALATFFSELTIADHSSCIVFDDPVTSLDHKWRNRIAKRIIEESKIRQVVLFTHDITFLMNLQEHSSKLDSEIDIQSLTRKRTETGIVLGSPPWDATSVKTRLGVINNMFQELKNVYEKETEEVYKIEVKRFYGRLRETWERFIEEDFLNQTVTRFGREIQTSRLKKVVKLQEDDYWVIDKNMKRCSTYFNGHDTSGNLIEESPSIDEIKEDIKIFKEFRLEIINNRK